MFYSGKINDSLVSVFISNYGVTPIQRSLFYNEWDERHSVWYNSKEYMTLQTSSHPLQHSFQLSNI